MNDHIENSYNHIEALNELENIIISDDLKTSRADNLSPNSPEQAYQSNESINHLSSSTLVNSQVDKNGTLEHDSDEVDQSNNLIVSNMSPIGSIAISENQNNFNIADDNKDEVSPDHAPVTVSIDSVPEITPPILVSSPSISRNSELNGSNHGSKHSRHSKLSIQTSSSPGSPRDSKHQSSPKILNLGSHNSTANPISTQQLRATAHGAILLENLERSFDEISSIPRTMSNATAAAIIRGTSQSLSVESSEDIISLSNSGTVKNLVQLFQSKSRPGSPEIRSRAPSKQSSVISGATPTNIPPLQLTFSNPSSPTYHSPRIIPKVENPPSISNSTGQNISTPATQVPTTTTPSVARAKKSKVSENNEISKKYIDKAKAKAAEEARLQQEEAAAAEARLQAFRKSVEDSKKRSKSVSASQSMNNTSESNTARALAALDDKAAGESLGLQLAKKAYEQKRLAASKSVAPTDKKDDRGSVITNNTKHSSISSLSTGNAPSVSSMQPLYDTRSRTSSISTTFSMADASRLEKDRLASKVTLARERIARDRQEVLKNEQEKQRQNAMKIIQEKQKIAAREAIKHAEEKRKKIELARIEREKRANAATLGGSDLTPRSFDGKILPPTTNSHNGSLVNAPLSDISSNSKSSRVVSLAKIENINDKQWEEILRARKNSIASDKNKDIPKGNDRSDFAQVGVAIGKPLGTNKPIASKKLAEGKFV